MRNSFQYDVIIIGGSYSGLAAGMALGRALRRVLIIDAGEPCNKQTPYSHNFLTNDGRPPHEIATLAKAQVQQYTTVTFLDAFAKAAGTTGTGFEVEVQSGENYAARKLVMATGIKDLMPGIPGIAESWGISVIHCPYCHGYEVRHQKTGILANGDLAMEMAAMISNWTNDLKVFTNGKPLLNDQQKATLHRHRIKIMDSEITRLENDNGHLKNVVFKDGTKAPLTAIYTRLPFIQHSNIPQVMGCELTPEGYIKIDSTHSTTIPGIYACGDNATPMRTVAGAVAMGTTTGIMVNRKLIAEDF